jgi:hypothetical protein
MDNHGFTPLFELSPRIPGCCYRLTYPLRNPEREKFRAFFAFSAESPLRGESGILKCALRLHRIAAGITEN